MTPQPPKQVRWVGQLSEEELLGIPVSLLPRRSQVPVRAAQPPPARRVAAPPSPVRRRQVREPLAVLALAGLVALMLGGVGAGSRFSGASPVSLDASAGQVVIDRQELGSLPRAVPSSSHDHEAGTSRSGTVEDRGSKPERKKEPSPPGGGGGGGGGSDEPSNPPLVQVTLPVVGTVTVDEPELPTVPEIPELPASGDVVPETATVPLP